MKNQQFSLGTALMSLVALWSTGGSYIFDWNNTHIYNPQWPPHAKFHNAQTMLLGTSLGLLSLWLLWIAKGERMRNIKLSAILASFYWLTQAGAIFFPGTALIDPEFKHPGQLPAQLIVDVVMLVMLVTGYWLASKKTKEAGAV
jgi:hypothetical protein